MDTPETDPQDEIESLRAQLRECREQLAEVRALARVASWRCDLVTRAVTHCDALPGILGADGRTCEDLMFYYVTHIHPDDYLVIMGAVREALQAGRAFEFEHRIVLDSGEERHVRVSGRYELDAEGRPVASRGVVTDVTARKARTARLTSALDLLPISVVEKDCQGRIMYINGRALEHLRTTREQVIGRTLDELLPPEIARSIRERERALRAEPSRGMLWEESYTLSGGEVRDILVAKVLLNPARPLESDLLSCAIDITDRKRAEDQLRQQKEFIRTVIDTVPQAVFVKDAHGRYVLVNKATAALFGTTPELLETRRDAEAHPVKDELRCYHAVDRQVIEEHLTIEYSAAFTRPDGREVWLRTIKTPVRLGEGAVGCLAVCTDITAERHHQLEIVAARLQAERASRAKSEFLSVMSHEIRTPLNAVIGITHLLLQESPRADQAENLKVLKFSAENLLVLVNDILDYSKIEAGRVELEETDLSLRELIEGVRLSLGAVAEEKGVAVRVQVAAGVPEGLIGDPVRIGQVLMNLVSNAVKFTRAGHVLIDARVRDESPDAVTVAVAVEDTGIGIAPEHIARIFDPFTQAQSSTTRRFGGTGLGLAITARLLKLHGSAIAVESEPGRGTRFSFELTLKRSCARRAGERTSPVPHAPADLRGLRVLLAEDNEANVCIASKFLQRWGARVDVAPHGLRAVEMASAGDYDVVLMDLQMPEMDGFEATRLIRAIRRDLPIIALTADALLESRGHVFDAGMNDFITKPFNPRIFFSKLARYSPAPLRAPSLRPRQPSLAPPRGVSSVPPIRVSIKPGPRGSGL